MEFRYKNTALFKNKEIEEYISYFGGYIEHLEKVRKSEEYNFKESSINLAFDNKILNEVKVLAEKKIGSSLKYIFVIGIGGSSLGIKAVYDALYGFFDSVEPKRFPKVIFIDTNDSEFLLKLKKFLQKEIKKPEEVFVNIITKSGKTIETIANAEFTLEQLSKLKNFKERLAVITDKGSGLWKRAEDLNIDRLSIPKNVGGRYSVLSAVGLFPLALLGLDIESLREGAKNMADMCLKLNEGNPALISAILKFQNYKNGKNINDLFLFHPELESLGKWYAQLIGESIGKEKDVNGKIVNVGITPIISIGSTDMHSLGQLFLSGAKNTYTCFVSTKSKLRRKAEIPANRFFPDLVKEINGKSMSEIMDAILEGVKEAYSKKGLAYSEVIFDKITLKSIGKFFQWKMMEIMFLGKLIRVDPFTQPSVDGYKAATNRILKN